jgi:hypothetical protein
MAWHGDLGIRLSSSHGVGLLAPASHAAPTEWHLLRYGTQHSWKLIDDARTQVTDPSDDEAIVPGD